MRRSTINFLLYKHHFISRESLKLNRRLYLNNFGVQSVRISLKNKRMFINCHRLLYFTAVFIKVGTHTSFLKTWSNLLTCGSPANFPVPVTPAPCSQSALGVLMVYAPFPSVPYSVYALCKIDYLPKIYFESIWSAYIHFRAFFWLISSAPTASWPCIILQLYTLCTASIAAVLTCVSADNTRSRLPRYMRWVHTCAFGGRREQDASGAQALRNMCPRWIFSEYAQIQTRWVNCGLCHPLGTDLMAGCWMRSRRCSRNIEHAAEGDWKRCRAEQICSNSHILKWRTSVKLYENSCKKLNFTITSICCIRNPHQMMGSQVYSKEKRPRKEGSPDDTSQ